MGYQRIRCEFNHQHYFHRQKEHMDCSLACMGMVIRKLTGKTIGLEQLKRASLRSEFRVRKAGDVSGEHILSEVMRANSYTTGVGLKFKVESGFTGYRASPKDQAKQSDAVKNHYVSQIRGEYGVAFGNLIPTLAEFGVAASLRYMPPGDALRNYIDILVYSGLPVIALARRITNGKDESGHSVVIDGPSRSGRYCVLDPARPRLGHVSLRSVVKTTAKGSENGMGTELVENDDTVWVLNGWLVAPD